MGIFTMTSIVSLRQRTAFSLCCILQTNGATPLFIASHQGHVEVVTTLLGRGASHAQAKVLHSERAPYQ
jgi:hypothetical protein